MLRMQQFQFTPLREGRPAHPDTTMQPTKFQFTPLREGRQVGDAFGVIISKFQFTPLREGRQQNSTKLHLTIYAVCRKSNVIFPYRNLFRLLKKLLWVYAKFAAYQLVCRKWLPVPVCKDGSRPIPTNLPATGYFHKSNLQKTQRTDANLSKPCFTAVSPFRHISPKRHRPQFFKMPCKNHHKSPHRFVQFFLRFLRAPAAKICTAEVCAYSSSGSPACMGAALPITSILFW